MEAADDSDSEGLADNVTDTKVGLIGDNVETEESNLAAGKKTKGRVKIKMEFIDNKLRRYTTFSKRKTGIMKKAYELSTLTGTQVMLLVASETGHVYTFATKKLQPMITSEEGKSLIQTCLNSPDPPSSSKGQQIDQRMSATGFEEPDLTYTLPTAAPSSSAPPPPPPAHNAGEGSSRSGGVEVKVEYHASQSKNMPPVFTSMYEPRAYYLDQASPSTNPASPEDRRPPIHEGASFYNSERLRDASPEFDARRSRPRSPLDHTRPHFYHESHRPRSPYRSDSPKYHTITPRTADRRFGRDPPPPPPRERSRSASPLQHNRAKYAVVNSDQSSRHSSGINNNRHNSPPPPSSHHYHHHQSRHASPPPPPHHHYHLPLPPSSSSSSRPVRSSRSRSRSPISPPLSGEGESSTWQQHRRRQQTPPPPSLMTTVNTHNKIMNASYHPKSPRAGINLSEGVKPGNFISTSALAMQFPNGTLISPGSLPPGISLAPLPPRGHTYVKLASGQSYIPVSSHSDSPTSRSPARSPMIHHLALEKDVNSSSSRSRNSRPDNRENNNGRERSTSPGWEDQDRNEARQSDRPSDALPSPQPPTSIVPPGFVLSSNYLLPVAQLPSSSAGSKPGALLYPPASSLSSSETSSQSITHLPDGAQYILNIPGLQTPSRSSEGGVGQGDGALGPHFIAIQVPVAAQQPPKAPKLQRQT